MTRHIDSETPPSLLLRMRDGGDTAAWQKFMDVYSPLLYGFCRLRGLQASDAADVTQEVLMRVCKSIRSFEYDRERGLFRDWLAKIVVNEIRRHSSKRKMESLANVPDHEQTAQVSAEWNDHFQRRLFDAAIENCRQRFVELTWQMFELSWLQRKPVAEVASKMNVSVEQVYVARSRVLKQLRAEVAVMADDFA